MTTLAAHDLDPNQLDLLHLVPEEWCKCGNEECPSNDGLASMLARVTFVFSGDPSLPDNGGILPGYVVLGIALIGSVEDGKALAWDGTEITSP